MNRLRTRLLWLLMLATALAMTACSTVDPRAGRPASPPSESVADAPSSTDAAGTPSAGAVMPSLKPPASASTVKRHGGYYQDDGPPDTVPPGLHNVPDAEPRIEPFAKGPSRPYRIFDKNYLPITDDRPFIQRGIGSWYGRKFHGQRTASGEIYDMFKMTAAHPTLPIPSYARVTNLQNGRQVIVRINDRGPFHSGRIIDLSYTAALKLDVLRGGSAELEVERLLPDEIRRMQTARQGRRETPVASAGTGAAGTGGGVPESATRNTVTRAAPTVTASSPDFYVQLGAYAVEQNALAAREELLRDWPRDLPPPVIVSSQQGLFRLHSGPFSSRERAAEAARQVRNVTVLHTTVVQR